MTDLPPNPEEPVVVPAQSVGPVPPVTATVNNTQQDSILAPAIRNGIRYLVGAGLTLGGSYLVARGLISADLVEPEDIQTLVDSPTVAGLILAISTGAGVLVERIWLNARKLGKST